MLDSERLVANPNRVATEQLPCHHEVNPNSLFGLSFIGHGPLRSWSDRRSVGVNGPELAEPERSATA